MTMTAARTMHVRANEQGAARRRLRRSRAMFCATNGCTSYLQPDHDRGVAVCPICGYERPLL